MRFIREKEWRWLFKTQPFHFWFWLAGIRISLSSVSKGMAIWVKNARAFRGLIVHCTSNWMYNTSEDGKQHYTGGEGWDASLGNICWYELRGRPRDRARLMVAVLEDCIFFSAQLNVVSILADCLHSLGVVLLNLLPAFIRYFCHYSTGI